MNICKLFYNGGSQAVRLPKEFQMRGEEVFARKIGDMVLLIPKKSLLKDWAQSLDGFEISVEKTGEQN